MISTLGPGEPLRVHAVVIGAGQAGPALATALAGDGETVVLFEGNLVGGTCVNTGCTPTKTLRKSARIAHLARRAVDFGVQTGDVTVDFAAVLKRVADTVQRSRDGLTRWIENTPNLTVVYDRAWLEGRVDDRFVVRSEHRTVLAERVYLNVGTSATMPTLDRIDEIGAHTSDTLLTYRSLPSMLVILGGSYIGVELGQIYRRLGADVTIIESSPQLMSREDPEVSQRLLALLTAEGINVLLNADITKIGGIPNFGLSIEGVHRDTGIAFEVLGSHLLVATGRRPNTAGLGLDSVGVTLDAQGYIRVNGALETNVPGIYALGDVNRRGAFTHTSWQDHEIVLANHRGGARTADGRVSTYAVYTDPPIGRVGLSLREARTRAQSGRRFLAATHEMSNVSRAREESETDGIITVVVDADTQRFAGATIFGIGGDEIIQVIAAMMAADAPYTVLRDFLPVHPTVTEFFPTILGKLEPLV